VNRESLARYVSFGDSFQSDSLFVGEVKGPAPGVDRGGFSRVQGETQEVATHRLPGDHVHTHGRAPEVSVVLRTYNRSHLLSRAILSVLDQDYTDFELLIVDDGSTDGTDALVRRFADPRIRYIRSPRNQGLGAARNLGIRESRGKYVAFLDSDDEWLPPKLSQQVDTLRQAPEDVGVVYSRYWHVQHGRARLSPPPLRQFAGNFEAPVRRLEGDVYRALLRGNFAPAQAALVRASCFERVGPADASLPAYEDWDLWLRIARHFRFVYQKTPLLYVYHTDDSISTKAERLATGLQSLAAKHESDPVAYRCLQAQYHNMMGKIKCREGLTGAARQHFVRAIRWRPSTMAFYLSTALTLLGAGAYTRLAHRLGI
jgi:glycosyltransferase involved in cell wall biosynthesis